MRRTKKFNIKTTIIFLVLIFLPNFTFGQGAPQALTIDEAVAESMNYFSTKFAVGTKVVVLNIESENENLSYYIADECSAFIKKKTKLLLVDKSQLPFIMNEKNIENLHEIDETIALDIAKKLGASSVIMGSISKLGANFRFRVQALSTADGKVFGVQSINVKEDEILSDLLLVGSLPQKFVLETTQTAQTANSDTKIINGIECVLVRAGSFTMGGEKFGNSSTQQVTLTQDFWISKYPITNAQFGRSVSGKANHPVVEVTWFQANDWAKSKGGRLPTEAEWEFAARGGVKSKGYIYSGSNNLDAVGWYSNNSGGSAKPVGQKQPNELGIYDMSGNVGEWCNDWYGDYSSSAVTNPTGPSTGGYRVFRGSGWSDDEQICRVASHYDSGQPSISLNKLGFRVVFDK
jgi:formylglycine-generating enzyme required for sulfatase activity